MTTSIETTNTLTRREWLLVILVLLMIEYWIISISHAYKDDQSLLNYVSFASTIASLLLAVVAIVYSFFQSDSATKTATLMLAQAENFSSVSGRLGASSDAIGAQLGRMVAVADKLDRLEASLDSSKQTLSAIEARVGGIQDLKEELRAAFAEKKAAAPVSVNTTLTVSTIARQVLRQSTFEADLITYALNRYVTAGTPLGAGEFISKYFAIISKASVAKGDAFQYTVVGYQLLGILRGLGLVEYDFKDKKLTLTQTLLHELPQLAAEVLPSDYPLLVEGRQLIDAVK